LWLKKRTVS